ncbi:uncharacterized protein DUF1648 [Halalkalibacter nanhaiisediminis]|uniref:Uncharacterized protein DUF1648 n=1 Tax=Halalkalibacter nanhaiisediminis TaxID=688079 RepID=A0A562QPN1_9BACI|nr:uncharacterized protein DUF1648 [Halalkalibacter nanhaiisediminis]
MFKSFWQGCDHVWNKISKFYSPFIDVLSFSLLILTISYVAMNYGTLPDEIPRHFNAIGDPDAWSGKGMLIVFLILKGFILLMLFLLNYFVFISNESAKDAIAFVNIPFVNKDQLTSEQAEVVRKLSARMLAIVNVCVSFLFFYIIYGTIQTALENQQGLGLMPLYITIVLVVISCYYTWKIYQTAKAENS